MAACSKPVLRKTLTCFGRCAAAVVILALFTAIEYQLHPLVKCWRGWSSHPLAKRQTSAAFLLRFQQYFARRCDRLRFFGHCTRYWPAVIIMAGYFGDNLAEGERLLAPVRQFGPPLADLIRPMAYSDLLALLDPIAPEGRNYYEPAYSIRQLSNEALDALITWAGKMTSPFSAILIHHVHGAATRVAPDATAFALREPHYMVIHVAAWDDGPADAHLAWARTSFARCSLLPAGVVCEFHPRSRRRSCSRIVSSQLCAAGSLEAKI